MNKPILLKEGTIVDGTGASAYNGDILIDKGLIKKISSKAIKADAQVINCKGKVISPGFIDLHSHNDWFMPSKENFKFSSPFIEQGITTSVAGNCGIGAFGFKENSPHMHYFDDQLNTAGIDSFQWRSTAEYFQYLEKKGIHQNIALLAGNGSIRTSIKGHDASQLDNDEKRDLLYLLEESIDHGARGVSFGMGYAPDIFMTRRELKAIGQLVMKKNRIITSHIKAFSSISGAYPVNPFGSAHNLKAMEDMIHLARLTGVTMHLSHLIFVGKQTWKTHEKALSLINKAVAEGLDITFDTYGHHCGATIIVGMLPDWFMAHVPDAYDNKKLLIQARLLMKTAFVLLGFNENDIQLMAARDSSMNKYNSMFLGDIARERKEDFFKTFITLAKKSNGLARILVHKYSNKEIILDLMKHKSSHFMTDAWIEPEGLQNPAAFGTMPRLLELARETGVLTIEETVHKMTGKNAQRVGITDRGVLAKGKAADIVVFDWNTIKDNTTIENTEAKPTGIEEVFINGRRLLKKGRAQGNVKAGKVLPQ
jgi:N-acyl-D-amino-acid deacylase